MPQRYLEIDEGRLRKMRDGLELLEMLDRDAVKDFDLCIYGITKEPQILDSAREAIAEDAGLAEEDVQLTEVAVAISISADTIYALLGSGIKLSRETFVYQGSGGEGVREMSFTFSHFRPIINLGDFSKIALASSDAWMDEFLKKEGSNNPARITPAVHRTEEATQPGVPTLQTPKQTSLIGGLKLSAILDDFLS